VADVSALLADLPFGTIGEVTPAPQLTVTGSRGAAVIDAPLSALKAAWQGPLRW
jgi:hypothetical protein